MTVHSLIVLASSPGSPSPFLTFSRTQILYAKNRKYKIRARKKVRKGEGEPGEEAMIVLLYL